MLNVLVKSWWTAFSSGHSLAKKESHWKWCKTTAAQKWARHLASHRLAPATTAASSQDGSHTLRPSAVRLIIRASRTDEGVSISIAILSSVCWLAIYPHLKDIIKNSTVATEPLPAILVVRKSCTDGRNVRSQLMHTVLSGIKSMTLRADFLVIVFCKTLFCLSAKCFIENIGITNCIVCPHLCSLTPCRRPRQQCLPCATE